MNQSTSQQQRARRMQFHARRIDAGSYKQNRRGKKFGEVYATPLRGGGT
jgi:hypothetical protein